MANEKRLIDANDLLKEINGIYQRHYANSSYKFIHDFFRAMFGRIKKAPTIDAVEVAHGEWSTIEDDYVGLVALQCSKCNEEYWFEEELPINGYNYCPNCGAKMRGSEE